MRAIRYCPCACYDLILFLEGCLYVPHYCSA
nr:MAG TPA: hypothetical protein [Caudoviricetes sp.]